MGSSGIYVNDLDLSDFGWVTESDEGLFAEVSQAIPTTPLDGVMGEAPLSADAVADARVVTLRGVVTGSTPADLRSRVRRLIYHCSQGQLELRSAYDADGFYTARYRGTSLPADNPKFASTTAYGTLRFGLTTPFLLERFPRSYLLLAGSANRRALPLGTGPSRPLFQLRGGTPSVQDPWIKLYDAFGQFLAQMRFTITLAADDWLAVDCLTRRISKCVAGTVSSADNVLTRGDQALSLLPRMGDPDAGYWPVVELGSTAGTARGVARVRRSWKI